MVSLLTAGTLALGIGASAAVFSVTDRVLLRPLPYPQADEIVAFAHAPTVYDQTGAAVQPEVAALREFAAIGLYGEGGANLSAGESAVRVRVTAASPGFFKALGVLPLRGRTFDPTETRQSKVAVVGTALWQRVFASDPAILGRNIRLNGQSFAVVGVMPATFSFPNGTEAWIPPLSDRQVSDGGLRGIGRIAAGVSVAQAAAALTDVYEDLYGAGHQLNTPLAPLRSHLVQGPRPTLLFLTALVGLLLAATWANLASLLLARLGSRERELIVRRALGASRGRMVGQLLTEAVVTTGLGALGGGLFAVVALRMFDTIGFPLGLDVDVAQVDTRFLLIVAGISSLSGLLFSVGPAFSVTRRPEAGLLQTGAVYRQRGRLGAFLVVLQIAFALVLLVAASCSLAALVRLLHVDLGFRNMRAFVMEVTLPHSRYGGKVATDAFIARFEATLKAMPGIRRIGTTDAPPGGSAETQSTPLTLDAAPLPPGRELPLRAALLSATPGYFEAAGIRLIAGRFFSPDDREGRPPVVILSDTAARALGSDPRLLIGRLLPMGQQLWGGVLTRASYSAEIVGIVGAVRLQGAGGQTPMQVYRAMLQTRGGTGALGFIVDGGPRAGGAMTAARQVLHRMDPELAPYNMTRLGDLRSRFLSTERLATVLSTGFSGIALLLCVIGLYGVLAQQVTERTREIAIRMALGADPSRLRVGVVKASARLALVGSVCGALGSLLAFQLASHLLPRLDRPAIPVIGGAAVVLVLVAVVASWVPAARASAVDPADALRAD